MSETHIPTMSGPWPFLPTPATAKSALRATRKVIDDQRIKKQTRVYVVKTGARKAKALLSHSSLSCMWIGVEPWLKTPRRYYSTAKRTERSLDALYLLNDNPSTAQVLAIRWVWAVALKFNFAYPATYISADVLFAEAKWCGVHDRASVIDGVSIIHSLYRMDLDKADVAEVADALLASWVFTDKRDFAMTCTSFLKESTHSDTVTIGALSTLAAELPARTKFGTPKGVELYQAKMDALVEHYRSVRL